jgi:hypothetical protein
MCGNSSSSSPLTSLQTTNGQTTGGTGSDSPTITSGGSVLVETGGKDVTMAALSGMTDVVKTALSNVGAAIGNQAEANQLTAANSTDLLKTILSSNNQLAQNSQTGGATAAISSTNYIIWGLMGLAALGLAGLGYFFFKRRA